MTLTVLGRGIHSPEIGNVSLGFLADRSCIISKLCRLLCVSAGASVPSLAGDERFDGYRMIKTII